MNNNNRGNNNSNNNRRRGRGGNNRQQGSGQQLNRIDSRARGNAPQLLEKYRKLAHDAHLNGDRVQEEYYLQFADHYFRVLADQRQRQEDQRGPRRDERWQEGGETFREDGEDAGEYAAEGEYQPYERQAYNRNDNRPDRDERPRDERPREARPRDGQREDRPRGEPQREEAQREEPPRDARGDDEGAAPGKAEVTAEPASPYEPPENPFVRGSRGLRPRREARPRPVLDAQDDAGDQPRDDAATPRGLDPAILPPPISVTRGDDEDIRAEADETPAPRRRTRRPRVVESDAGEGEPLKEAS